MYQSVRHTILVIIALIVLALDQVAEWRQKGVAACFSRHGDMDGERYISWWISAGWRPACAASQEDPEAEVVWRTIERTAGHNTPSEGGVRAFHKTWPMASHSSAMAVYDVHLHLDRLELQMPARGIGHSSWNWWPPPPPPEGLGYRGGGS